MSPEVRTCLDVRSDGSVKFSTARRVQALKILAQHLDLIDPPEAPPPPTGPVTVNMTEIYLDGLSVEELEVLQKVFARKAVIDAEYGLAPATTPTKPPESTS
jgi:hypothetical protein